MERLIAMTNKIVHGGLYLFTVILILTTGTQIFLRVLLNLPLSWTEEVARYAFIWWVFLGAMIALREGRHLGIDALMTLFPRKVCRWWEMGISLSILGYLAVMLFQGVKLVRIQMIHSTPITGVPLGYVISIIPICAVIMGLYTLDGMRKKWRERG